MLELRNLTLTVAGRRLCASLNARLGDGENWVVLGANGSGKTTLLHTLAGLRAPDDGEVLLDDRPLRAYSHRARALRLGVLLQDYETSLPATVLEMALTGRHPHLDRWQWEDEQGHALTQRVLVTMGLAGFESRLLSSLSGGERRRAEIAALLVQDAPLCLLDEPTNHLDLQHQVDVLGLLTARAREPGHLNVMVLHDINLALRFGTHAILLFGDGSTLQGPIAEVVSREHLEQLYRCRLREVRDGDRPCYLPA